MEENGLGFFSRDFNMFWLKFCLLKKASLHRAYIRKKRESLVHQLIKYFNNFLSTFDKDKGE